MNIVHTTNIELDKTIIEELARSREGSVFSFNYPETNQKKALKYFTWRDPEVLNLKEKTIKRLLNNRRDIYLPELVLPETLYKVTAEDLDAAWHLPWSATRTIAFSMDLYEKARTLESVLDDKTIPIAKKIEYLKKLGIVLEKMKEHREQGLKHFYLNDLHERNVLVDGNDNLRIIDLDSCQLYRLPALSSKYLTSSLSCTSKYKYMPRYFPYSSYLASENTDLYCYITIILNFVTKQREINRLLLYYYEKLLDYLKDHGVSRELIEAFAKIYSDEPNINPYEMLDGLLPYLESHGGKRLSLYDLN